MATKTIYPRIPESNWWTLRDQFAKTLPNAVTASYLKALLQLTSDQAARNLLSPLQRLGLIDASGKPTDRANAWRINAKYAQACQEIIADVYPPELRDLYSGGNIDRKKIEQWFKDTARLGDTAARQSAALYILLNRATPLSSADFAKAKQPGPKSGSPAKRDRGTPAVAPAEKTESPAIAGSDALVPGLDTRKESTGVSLHIDLQIHISPEANAEQIDQIFASIAKHIMIMRQVKQSEG